MSAPIIAATGYDRRSKRWWQLLTMVERTTADWVSENIPATSVSLNLRRPSLAACGAFPPHSRVLLRSAPTPLAGRTSVSRAATSVVLQALVSCRVSPVWRFNSTNEIDFFQKYFCRLMAAKVFLEKDRSGPAELKQRSKSFWWQDRRLSQPGGPDARDQRGRRNVRS